MDTPRERDNQQLIRRPLKAIRAFCLECVGGSRKKVAQCTARTCKVYPYRFGKDPFHAKAGKKIREKVGLDPQF